MDVSGQRHALDPTKTPPISVSNILLLVQYSVVWILIQTKHAVQLRGSSTNKFPVVVCNVMVWVRAGGGMNVDIVL